MRGRAQYAQSFVGTDGFHHHKIREAKFVGNQQPNKNFILDDEHSGPAVFFQQQLCLGSVHRTSRKPIHGERGLIAFHTPSQ